jgi:DNA-binding transcriptional ArsR family regulator
MSPRRDMTEEAFEAVAQRFRVLSDPMRLKLLYTMGGGEMSVNELVEKTGGTQSNVSKHLSTLLTHGLVQRRRQGTSAFYSVTDAGIFDLCDMVCGGIDRHLQSRRDAFR